MDILELIRLYRFNRQARRVERDHPLPEAEYGQFLDRLYGATRPPCQAPAPEAPIYRVMFDL